MLLISREGKSQGIQFVHQVIDEFDRPFFSAARKNILPRGDETPPALGDFENAAPHQFFVGFGDGPPSDPQLEGQFALRRQVDRPASDPPDATSEVIFSMICR